MTTIRKTLMAAAIALAAVTLAGCNSGPATAGLDKPGNPDVYVQLDSMTTCSALQKMFNNAMDNHDRAASGSRTAEFTLGYAKYANARMQDLAC